MGTLRIANTPSGLVAAWNGPRKELASRSTCAAPILDARQRLAVLEQPAGDGHAGSKRQVVCLGAGDSFWKRSGALNGAPGLDAYRYIGFGHSQQELAFCVRRRQRIETLQSPELDVVSLAKGERLHNDSGDRFPGLVKHAASQHQGGVAYPGRAA